jgi:hypothetical protein
MKTTTSVERRTLGTDYQISAILNGLWQVSGGHGVIDEEIAVKTVRYQNIPFKNNNNYNKK